MEEQIRILQVLGRLDRGGAETMIMTLYRYMDRSRIQFDFVIHTQDRCDFTEEVERLGGRIYSMKPFRAATAPGYRRQWRRFFKEHPEYHVIHGHMRSTASLYLWEAKRAGLATIVHSHNTSSGTGAAALVKNILQYPLRYEADYLFACSSLAGAWLFGRRACRKKKFHILNNGIETGAFHFEQSIREEKRRELLRELPLPYRREQDVVILLHVGRMERQKNHGFLLHVMRELAAKKENVVLLLCGEGPLEERLRAQAESCGLQERVRFLGVRGDVPALMQAADGMLFPSLFEGFPVTLIEAQATGLPVLMSDTITGEAILTELVRTMPLTESAERWAREAQAMLEEEGSLWETRASLQARRGRYADIVAGKGYDVKENAEKLAAFYLSLWRKS